MDVQQLYRQIEIAKKEMDAANRAVTRAVNRVTKANRRLNKVEAAVIEGLRKRPAPKGD